MKGDPRILNDLAAGGMKPLFQPFYQEFGKFSSTLIRVKNIIFKVNMMGRICHGFEQCLPGISSTIVIDLDTVPPRGRTMIIYTRRKFNKFPKRWRETSFLQCWNMDFAKRKQSLLQFRIQPPSLSGKTTSGTIFPGLTEKKKQSNPKDWQEKKVRIQATMLFVSRGWSKI